MVERDDSPVRVQAFRFLEVRQRTYPHAIPWSVLM
jgi:hypothetical protein